MGLGWGRLEHLHRWGQGSRGPGAYAFSCPSVGTVTSSITQCSSRFIVPSQSHDAISTNTQLKSVVYVAVMYGDV